MKHLKSEAHHEFRRRGAVAVLVAVMMVVFMGFGMLVIDVGVIYSAKGDLQRAADAAALAAASSYLGETGMRQDENEIDALSRDRAQTWSAKNTALTSAVQLEDADIAIGRHDFSNVSSSMTNDTPYNAVEVVVRREAGHANGAVPLFFAKVFGKNWASVNATARAAVDDRFAGYRYPQNGNLMPFTIHVDRYNDQVANGPDSLTFDDGVIYGSDGVNEVTLFPWKESGGGSGKKKKSSDDDDNSGAGNFGTLNVGINNQGTSALEEQIENGITAEQFEDEFGASELIFFDGNGQNAYMSTGNPGMSVGMEDTLTAKIGDLIGFFIHDNVSETGSNAEFNIVGIRFGRIVEVNLTGNPDNRSLTIQPVAYADENVITNNNAPSSNGQVQRLQLVK